MPKQLDPRWVAAKAALRPRMSSLYRPAAWRPEVAETAPLALPEAVAPAALAAALLAAPAAPPG